ncbi:MAG: phytase [Saccharospirillaceae bacterium]|nr:phytase [Saccharospirillaceae bacterium]MCD8532360.1 phytase [Saccharospirillaceae bacterium]
MTKQTMNSTLSAATLSLLLTACSGQDIPDHTGQQQRQPSATLTASPLSVGGEQALLPDGDNTVLSAGPDSGIQLHRQEADGRLTLLDKKDIPAEFIDQRRDQLGTLFVSIDQENNRPVSYRIHNQRITDLAFGQPLTYPIEGICLYQPAGSPLQLFVLDEQQMAHQLLIKSNGSELTQQEIRRFPLPPNSEYCVVDDISEQLFVSEENVGVWAYNARAESEVSRQVVDLVQPWGQLHHNSGPLAISQGQLFIAELGSNILHHYPLPQAGSSQTTGAGRAVILDQSLAADSLRTAINGDGTTRLIILDDDSSQLFSSNIQLPQQARKQDGIPNIAARAETIPVRKTGDAADDPAIWVNTHTAENSRILGTNKKFGLYVYDLQGQELQELQAGRVNNVDIRQGFTFKNQPADIAAASQRDRQAIALFHIDPMSGHVSATTEISTTLDNVYGLCMYKNRKEQIFVFINDEDGRFEQYEITDSANGWRGKKVREFRVNSQPEGCAADDIKHQLFLGEENVAIWTIGAEADAGTTLTQLAAASDMLVADIEGMDIYRNEKEAYLVVSSQGNDSYVLYQAEAPYDYIGRFRVGINAEKGIDGASETDGLTVTSANLGADYPQGMLVVQDGRNFLPEENQNFKYVNWQDIQALMQRKQP